MKESEKAYLAGIIDSEGCIFITKWNNERNYELSIKMTDNFVISFLSQLLSKEYENTKKYKRIRYHSKQQIFKILSDVLPYLNIKYKQAVLIMEAISIKKQGDKNIFYSDDENKKWQECHDEIRKINAKGKEKRIDYQGNDEHKFHWAWLAGLIDGDGWVGIDSNKRKNKLQHRTAIRISITHKYTIDYLCAMFDKNISTCNPSRKNASRLHAVRFLTNSLSNILPNILPFLKLKNKQAVILYDIIKLRKAMPPGAYKHKNNDMIKKLILEVGYLNEIRGK